MKVRFYRQGNVVALRDPYTGIKNRIQFYTNVKDVPSELDQWLDVNPRSQNLVSDVSNQIKMSLLEETDNPRFYLRNRGIKLSIAKVDKCINTDDEMIFELNDPELHGIIDGGHTYKVIRANSRSTKEDQFVMFDVIVGLDEIKDISQALNTSAMVDLRTIADHWGYFDTIDDLIEGLPFQNRVEKYQNYRIEQGIEHPIDIRTLIGVIDLMNIDIYPTGTSNRKMPSVAVYDSINANLTRYVKRTQAERDVLYIPMKTIIAEITALYDVIERDTAVYLKQLAASKSGKELIYQPKGVFAGHTHSTFTDQDLGTPSIGGVVFPIFSAMRNLITKDSDGVYKWKQDPIEFWNHNKKAIFAKTVRLLEKFPKYVNGFGKKAEVWLELFNEVERLYYTRERVVLH